MREIEFRGKSISTGNSIWIYGGIDIQNGDATIFDHNCMCHSAYDVDIETVGQYTGLKDSKRTDEFTEGQKIYEGDIVASYNQIGLVVYSNSTFLIDWYKNGEYDCGSYLWKCRKIEIIGNIHDNPELLAK